MLSLLHRTTMECIVLRWDTLKKSCLLLEKSQYDFPASYYDGTWTVLRKQTSFHSKNPNFINPNPKFDPIITQIVLETCLQVYQTTQGIKQHIIMQFNNKFHHNSSSNITSQTLKKTRTTNSSIFKLYTMIIERNPTLTLIQQILQQKRLDSLFLALLLAFSWFFSSFSQNPPFLNCT